MIKSHYEETTVEQEIIDDVICNCCGQPIKRPYGRTLDDYIHITKQWGYASDYENETHNIDLCEDCYKNIIKKFKIRPNIL